MNKTDFSELQSLLRAEADQVPHYDLEQGFLDDLHRKIRVESIEKAPSWFSNFKMPSLVWGGAFAGFAAAVAVCFVAFSGNAVNSAGFTASAQDSEGLLYIDGLAGLDTTGSIATYISHPLEF